MLDLVGTIFSSVLAGGATGLLGVAFQRFADYKNRQIDAQMAKDRMAHEASLRDKDAAIMDKEWAGRLRVAEAEGAAAMDVQDGRAFAVGLTSEPQRYSDAARLTTGQMWLMVLLDVVRGIIRPGLTVYLCAVTTLIYIELRAIMALQALWTAPLAADLMKQIVITVLYLTTTCVLWWFGTRNKQGVPQKSAA
jgi:hypothetical protein